MILREAVSESAKCGLTTRMMLTVLVLGLSAGAAAAAIVPAPPQINASSFLLLDTATGEVLAEENSTLRLPPASLTKMMTAYSVIMLAKKWRMDMKNTEVSVAKKCESIIGTTANLKEGHVLSVWDLLHGCLLPSGNDASFLLA